MGVLWIVHHLTRFSRLQMRPRHKSRSAVLGVEGINPALRASPKLQAKQLKQWLDEHLPQMVDDHVKREITRTSQACDPWSSESCWMKSCSIGICGMPRNTGADHERTGATTQPCRFAKNEGEVPCVETIPVRIVGI